MNAPTPEALAVGEMENRFREASDLVERYMIDGATVGHGAAVFATWHLISRSLADLRAGQFLASSGFPIQMASVVRPVIESLNLIELFAQEPEAAQRWADGQWQEFMPGRVRERLGLGNDPVYSWLSEHSHPRFAGLQLTAYRIVREDAEREVARIYSGGLPLEFPSVLLATMNPSNVLCQLALALDHLPVKEEVAGTWPTVARQVAETVLPGYEAVIAALAHHQVGEETAAALLATVNEAIAHGRELEELVRQEREQGQ